MSGAPLPKSPQALAAVLLGLGLRRGRLSLLRKAGVDLLQDRRQILSLGPHVARMIPLEMRVELAAHAPIGVAEVVVDDGIGGFQFDRLFELARRFLVMTELEIGPAEAIHDIAVRRTEIDGAAQHFESLVKI